MKKTLTPILKKVQAGFSLLVMLSFFALAPVKQADAANIAYFNNGAFVDMSTITPCFAEGIQFDASIQALGNTVTTFTGLSAADLTAALDGQQLLVIPETEVGNLVAALTPDAVAVIEQFVFNGGGLLLGGGTVFAGSDAFQVLNAIFGFSISDGLSSSFGSSAYNSAAATGTSFEGGPLSVPNNSLTHFLTGTLPPGTLSIYQSSPTLTTVALIPYGTGNIAYIGWDWFDGGPGCGAETAAWNTVLDNAITAASGEFVPPPPPPPPVAVPTMGQWGLILLTLIMLTLGQVWMMSKETYMQATSGNKSFSFKMQQFPFDAQNYFKIWGAVILSIMAVFTIAMTLFSYELTSADIPGSILASFVLSYMIYLFTVETE